MAASELVIFETSSGVINPDSVPVLTAALLLEGSVVGVGRAP